MKTIFRFVALLVIISLWSCSKDDDAAPSKLKHSGEKWTISSLEYKIVDQGFSNPTEWVKMGSTENAGAFYFNGSQGSFDILVEGDRQEDYFGCKFDGSSVTILQIDQSVSTSKFSQNIITLNGEKATSTMTLQGTFTRQSLSGQYVFTGTFVLTKE